MKKKIFVLRSAFLLKIGLAYTRMVIINIVHDNDKQLSKNHSSLFRITDDAGIILVEQSSQTLAPYKYM